MAWIKFTLVTIFWKIFWYTIHFYWQFPFNPTARNSKFLCSANKNAWLCLIDQWKSSIILFWEFVTCRFCLTQCWRRCSNLGTSSSWCWRPGWSRWSRTMTRCWWYWSWWWCWYFLEGESDIYWTAADKPGAGRQGHHHPADHGSENHPGICHLDQLAPWSILIIIIIISMCPLFHMARSLLFSR